MPSSVISGLFTSVALPEHRLRLSPGDRLMVLAPHPDDESLATGGLLQTAIAARADVRVLVVTNGERNPWPQRFCEQRWRIGPQEEARWSARRQEEATAATAALGLPGEYLFFLDCPDQGLTHILLQSPDSLIDRLISEFDRWPPSHLIGPSLADLHPDHSALAVLTALALTRWPGKPSLLQHYAYRIHGPPLRESPGCLQLSLNPAQTDHKRKAILCHASQMRLSRNRFLAYAQPSEWFQPFEKEFQPNAVLQAISRQGSAVELVLRHGSLDFWRPARIWLLLIKDRQHDFLQFKLPSISGRGKMEAPDRSGMAPLPCEAIVESRRTVLKIDLGTVPDFGFVKYVPRWKIFLDKAGWSVIIGENPIAEPKD